MLISIKPEIVPAKPKQKSGVDLETQAFYAMGKKTAAPVNQNVLGLLNPGIKKQYLFAKSTQFLTANSRRKTLFVQNNTNFNLILSMNYFEPKSEIDGLYIPLENKNPVDFPGWTGELWVGVYWPDTTIPFPLNALSFSIVEGF